MVVMQRAPRFVHGIRFPTFLLFALLIFFASCSSMPPDPSSPSSSASNPGLPTGASGATERATGEQRFNTQRHPESPVALNDSWRGILIKAPAVLRLDPRRPAVTVRGVYALSGVQVPLKSAMKLIAIDAKTKRRYEGFMGQQDPSPEEPLPDAPPLDPGMRERLTFNGHFNVELLSSLNLPLVAATYVVSAELGTARSNEISVKLQLP
jgi:hypothetical protein